MGLDELSSGPGRPLEPEPYGGVLSTHIVRQLYQPPWAEYAILHLYILAGGDRLANLVQWAAMAVSLFGVSVIARQLGAGPRGQLLSAAVCATIPMGIMQASTTQNDYVATLWLVCLTSALLAIGSTRALPCARRRGEPWLGDPDQGYCVCPRASVRTGASRSGSDRPLDEARTGSRDRPLRLTLNAPQYVRNFELFGSPLGPGAEEGKRYMNDEFSPSILASNLLRNLGLHAGTPWQGANARIERASTPCTARSGSRWTIHAAHGRTAVRSEAARRARGSGRQWSSPPANRGGDGGGLARSRRRRLRAFAGCLLVAFLLFCLVLRWQPWHSRLHLPLFVLGAPMVGAVFERQRPALLVIALLLLAGSSVRFLTENNAHHLVGRRSIFSSSWAEQRVAHAWPAYVGATRFVLSTGCAEVGLFLRGDDREYFVWALLADVGWRGRLGPVLVTNGSASAQPGGRSRVEFRPCAIVRQDAGTPGGGLTLGARSYRTTWSRDDIQVLVPDVGQPHADRTTEPRGK